MSRETMGFANHAEDSLGRAGAELTAGVHKRVALLVTHKSSGVRQPQGPGPSPSPSLPPEHPSFTSRADHQLLGGLNSPLL